MKFEPSQSEVRTALSWQTEHPNHCFNPNKYILYYSYIFVTGSGMGTAFKVRCNACEVEYDATDYDSW